MPELLEEQRETWGTRGGFVLAAVGSAVGLGNLWGFPYKIYSYGGGAFLIPYITAMFVIGIPMLILEFSLGHFTQRAAPDAFARTNKKLEFVGWWGIILGFVIITYYPVILAYCFSFLWISIKGIWTGGELPWAGQGIEGVQNAKKFFFDTYLGYTEGIQLGSLRLNILWPLIIAWAAMYFCIFKGVKLVGKIVWLTVPLPWLMLLILTVRGLTLPGSMKGLVYYLDPVWSELAKPSTWRFAFGQVFFSLSLAFGVMITYASFLHRKSDINNNAAIIGISDFATSFVAGLAIFATLGAMAFATEQAGNPVPVEKVVESGPGLAFVAFPYALAQLPYSAWFSFVFFFALVTLGIDSAFSITESVLASIVDKTGWSRRVVLPVMSFVGLAAGTVYATNGGLNWLGTIDDFINGTWGITFLGLLECVALGWFYRVDRLRRHANARSDWKLGRWWNYLIRVIVPVILGSLVLWNLFEDFTKQGGFFIDSDGNWILPNCVGMTVVGLAPILAVALSWLKTPLRQGQYQIVEDKTVSKARLSGIVALVFALVPLVVFIWVFITVAHTSISHVANVLLLASLFLAIGAVVSSNNQLDRHDTSTTRASWFARWAGLIGTIDISAVIALYLINLTKYKFPADKADKVVAAVVDEQKLGGVSYIILGFAFLVIICGLGWCFYRAMAAAAKEEGIQHPEEVGDEQQ